MMTIRSKRPFILDLDCCRDEGGPVLLYHHFPCRFERLFDQGDPFGDICMPGDWKYDHYTFVES